MFIVCYLYVSFMSRPLVEIQGNKELKNALSHFKLELFVFVVELM